MDVLSRTLRWERSESRGRRRGRRTQRCRLLKGTRSRIALDGLGDLPCFCVGVHGGGIVQACEIVGIGGLDTGPPDRRFAVMPFDHRGPGICVMGGVACGGVRRT